MRLYVTPGLSGLELGKGLAGGATLFELRGRKDAYFPALREFLLQLHQGRAAAEDAAETAAMARAAGFRHAVFGGGGALDPALAGALNAAPLPFSFEISAGPHSGSRGAFQVFRDRGWQRGVALDLGQTQLKVITAQGNSSSPRDLTLLPVGAHALDPAVGQARIREMLLHGVGIAGSMLGGPPDGVVLALPVSIDSEGTALPASYPGLFGPLAAIFSNLFACDWVYLNDAVLAALGFPPKSGEKTLVVTLGFAVGGALWDAS